MYRAWLWVCLLLALSGCDRVSELISGESDPPPVAPVSAPVAAPIADPGPPPIPTDNGAAGNTGTGTPADPIAAILRGLAPALAGLPIPGATPAATRTPPAPGSLAPAPAGSSDRAGHLQPSFLSQRAEAIHRELLAALPEEEGRRVRAIPLEVVTEANQPNAAAACRGGGREALMMITTGMLELCAGIAETLAYDEAAGTDTHDQYVTTVVSQVRGQQPIAGVPPAMHQAPHATDANKLARQIHLFDQQVAFILGHELAHHYRGHTNCVSGRSAQEVQRDEMLQVLAHTVPPFSQPREVEADLWGVSSVMEAGHARAGGVWTEEGAMVNLEFFRRLADRGGAELVMAFLSTHPPALLRIPIIQTQANQWQPGRWPPVVPLLMPGAAEGGAAGGRVLPGRLPIDLSNFPLPIPLGRRND